MPPGSKDAGRTDGSRWTRAASLALAVVFMNAIVAVTVALALARSRSLLEERAKAVTTAMARTLVLDIESSLGQADLALRWAAQVGPGGFRALVEEQGGAIPFLGAVRFADAHGNPLPGPGPSVSGQDFFRRLREGGAWATVTTGLLADPATGDMGVILGRRLEGPDGSFRGIAYVLVEQTRIVRSLGMVDFGSSGLVSLRGLDLALIARVPPSSRIKNPPESLVDRLRAGESYGCFLNRNPLDGIQRLVAFRVLPDHPFVVVAGSALQDYLAAWRREAIQGAVLGGVFLVLSILTAVRMRKSWRRDAEAGVAVATLEARAQEDALKDALYEISQATLEAPGLEPLLRRIHVALSGLLPAANFFVAVLDEGSGLITFPYFVDERDPVPEPRPRGNSLTDIVLRTGRPLLLTPEGAHRLREEEGLQIAGSRPLDWLGVPLLEREVPFGVMAVQSYSQDVRYSSADAKLMALVSAQVAASIRRKRSEEELRASEDRFAKAFRANPDAVSINRLEDGRFLVVNEGFTRVFGWSEAEVLGRTSLADGLDLWVDPEDRRRMTEALERSGRVEGLEVTFRRRDGGFVAGLVSSTLIEVAGKPCSLTITRDVTVLRAQARQLERMTRIYAAHSQVSQAVVRFPNEQEMLERICQVLVEDGKFTLAWLGWNDPATSQIRVAAQSGDAAGFLDEFPIRSDDTPLGRRPAGTAIREGRTVFLNDFVAATEHSPWGGAAVRAGFQACAALPIRRAGQVRGVLVVYAREKGFFGELEVALLEEVAATVSYAVDHGDLERGRLLAERNLRLEHDRAETYLRVAGVILLALDPELRVAMLNRKGYDVAGRPEGSLLGQDWLAATAPPGIAEGTRDQLLRVLRSGTAVPFTQEAWLVRGDNDRRLIAWTNTVLRDEEGRPTGLLCSGEDLTERRRTEEERESLQAQLAQAQKLESLGSLAGGVAHDMNNVLAAILALASTQTEGTASGGPAPGSPAHRAFERIIQAAVRGGKMVKTLLSFARKNPTETREVDLGALLREQAQLLEHTTLSRVRVELDLAPELRPVRGDASALSHVFLNLCVNAVDAMPEGGTLTLRTRNLEGDQVEVEVADTGVGMPPEVLGKALDPFFTTKAEGRGTGLGLSMAYSTVKAHLGTITIQSEPGRGTRVRLVFPAMAPGAAPEPEPRRTGPGHPASLKVLLVDDDDLVRESESVCLETLGHSVLQAASGEEGLAILEEGFHPDLVVLDMNMPGLGGAGTLDLLRKWRPATPVIVATGRVDQSALDMVGAHPGVTLLPKPFDLQDLKAHLDRIPWA